MGKKSKRPVKAHIDYSAHGTLDTFLPAKNLCRKPIAKDGSCLFRAVAEQVCSWSAFILLLFNWDIHVKCRCIWRSPTIINLDCSVWSTFVHTQMTLKQ